MTALPDWHTMEAGNGCPFCAPQPEVNEYTFKIADLSVATLWLERNQTYRGYCILIFSKRHVTGLEHLTAEEHAAFADDLRRAGQAVHGATRPAHMNYATLGNVIPHLHYHIIPRYESDPRWQAPIWTSDLADMPRVTLTEGEYAALVRDIRAEIEY